MERGEASHQSSQPALELDEFLLGFPPFACEMAWAPERQYHGASGDRLYNEMHTADWWWETQEKLPPGATVVPVILASDKTQLTRFAGDVSPWPVYLTIGNFSRELRRRQTVPSKILIGFIPKVKTGTRRVDDRRARDINAQAYHDTLRLILERE